MKRIIPKAGQESVWDYPRPPRVEPVHKRVVVVFNGETIADTTNAKRVLETSHPPSYYIPPEDIRQDVLVMERRTTVCEFKGSAHYYSLELDGKQSPNAAWAYSSPRAGFETIRDHLAFYPSRVDACFVDDEQVQTQEGDFYGGWITQDIVGPFKGGPGTWGW
jgi:uncharacterized protein (DUF427 family)